MVDLCVKIGSVTLKNPIMPASGCFSTELAQVIDSTASARWWPRPCRAISAPAIRRRASPRSRAG